ncbi:MAG: hypothetical protein MUE98_00290 [Rhodobacteraceae bacterium]|jgi:hypothetical protein|nr:hypothetical protein [Paracoccaceae bacterium]
MSTETLVTASGICDLLGRGEMAAALGVRKTAISNAAVAGRFPAKWYAVIADLCAAKGASCPRELFAFVSPAPSDPALVGDETVVPAEGDAA